MKSQKDLIFGLVVGVALVVQLSAYLVLANAQTAIGFPLDDAWIHQTYARNLGVFGEWAFLRGQPSAGSTAPLWTFWLSVGYLAGINYYAWAFVSGGIALAAVGFLSAELIREVARIDRHTWWVAVFMVSEWHLVWAALSGMETIVLSAVFLAVFLLLSRQSISFWRIGILIGLACWLRPDGISLLGPALLMAARPGERLKQRGYRGLKLIAGFLAFFIPYLVFNQIFAGSIWPNTFFAKQAEYASHLEIPLITRLSDLLILPLVGAGALLAPGFIYACTRCVKERNWWGIGAGLWWFGFTLIYALRLPVTYQHGRYLIPAMPVFWVIGWLGTIALGKQLRARQKNIRLYQFGGGLGLALLLLIFGAFGMKAYAEDVAIINSEMVETARWVAENTPPDALIGAHDIGALGFFGDRDIIDLAGLVSPQVIPFIRDEAQLIAFLNLNKADYLVTFPGWYPEMTQGLPLVYQSKAPFAPLAGGENMAVYRLFLGSD